MTLDRNTLAKKIYDVSNIKGRFRLRSGAISDEYFDKYLFEADPALLREIAVHLREIIPGGTEIIAGLELGGVPLATALSGITGLPLVLVRKKAKEYGTCKLAEGGEIKDRTLLVVEDVVTTGGQIIASAKELRQLGARIAGVVCVIDREAGAKANLTAEDLPFQPLFTMSEIKSLAGVNA
jgi:orotate phosphoribosyltransferase